MSNNKNQWIFGIVVFSLCAAAVVPPVHAQSCKQSLVNVQGTAGADITVSSTAVVVQGNNPTRCTAILKNNHASNSMRCMASTQGTPTSTAGVLLASGEQMKLTGASAGNAWRCIRVTSDAAAQVFEETP